MAKLYNLCSYRTGRLLEDFSRQADQVQLDLEDRRVNLTATGAWLTKCMHALRRIDTRLQTQRLSCERSRTIHDKCRQALERNDFEQLVDLRDRLLEDNRRRA